MKAVTAMQSPAGMAVSAIQANRRRQRGRRLGGGARPCAASARRPSAPATQMPTASSAKPHDHIMAWVRNVKKRLDQERIGEQRRERAEVGGGVEHIRVLRLRMAGGDEPVLQQRRARRQRHERQADRGGEQADQPGVTPARGRRIEARRRYRAAASWRRRASSSEWTSAARPGDSVRTINARRGSRRTAAPGTPPWRSTRPTASRRAWAAPSW